MQGDEGITLRSLLDEIIKNRNDLRNVVEASEARVLLKIENVNNKVSELEKENQELKNKVESLEKISKRNNIIIFGLKKGENKVTPQYICDEIGTLLGVHLVEADIDDVYSFGDEEGRPIKVELLSQVKKKLVIKNCYKLKGKGVSISHDLTEKQRKEGKILRKYLREAKEDKKKNCYIKGNKLIINSVVYTAHDLEQLENTENTIEKLNNSAPATPSAPRSLELSEKNTDPPQLQATKTSTSQKPRKNSVSSSPKGAAACNKTREIDSAKKIVTRSIASKPK